MKQKVWSFLKVIIGILVFLFIMSLLDNYKNDKEKKIYNDKVEFCKAVIKDYEEYREIDELTDKHLQIFCQDVVDIHDDYFD